MNAKFAAVPPPRRWRSPDADSFWSASGGADGPINGDHSARHLFIYVTAMLIFAASVGGIYNIRAGQFTSGSWLQMESSPIQPQQASLSPQANGLINIQVTCVRPSRVFSLKLRGHSEICHVKLAPSAQTEGHHLKLWTHLEYDPQTAPGTRWDREHPVILICNAQWFMRHSRTLMGVSIVWRKEKAHLKRPQSVHLSSICAKWLKKKKRRNMGLSRGWHLGQFPNGVLISKWHNDVENNWPISVSSCSDVAALRSDGVFYIIKVNVIRTRCTWNYCATRDTAERPMGVSM